MNYKTTKEDYDFTVKTAEEYLFTKGSVDKHERFLELDSLDFLCEYNGADQYLEEVRKQLAELN